MHDHKGSWQQISRCGLDVRDAFALAEKAVWQWERGLRKADSVVSFTVPPEGAAAMAHLVPPDPTLPDFVRSSSSAAAAVAAAAAAATTTTTTTTTTWARPERPSKALSLDTFLATPVYSTDEKLNENSECSKKKP